LILFGAKKVLRFVQISDAHSDDIKYIVACKLVLRFPSLLITVFFKLYDTKKTTVFTVAFLFRNSFFERGCEFVPVPIDLIKYEKNYSVKVVSS
jgi:hypothetical protein